MHVWWYECVDALFVNACKNKCMNPCEDHMSIHISWSWLFPRVMSWTSHGSTSTEMVGVDGLVMAGVPTLSSDGDELLCGAVYPLVFWEAEAPPNGCHILRIGYTFMAFVNVLKHTRKPTALHGVWSSSQDCIGFKTREQKTGSDNVTYESYWKVQGGAPKLVKLAYNYSNYYLWEIQL